MNSNEIEAVVKAIVSEYINKTGAATANTSGLPCVMKKSLADVKREKFDTGNPKVTK